ncbi:hypothetical protein HDU82_001783 [Entophlyctis luteolus]|nr:hypothetical protein HDU82_001783 [Entophlyctis luteolus]
MRLPPSATAQFQDSFHTPSSRKEIAYLRLMLRMVLLRRLLADAFDLVNVAADSARVVATFCSALWLALSVQLVKARLHALYRALIPTPVISIPDHDHDRPQPSTSVVILTRNNAPTVANACALLCAYSARSHLLPSPEFALVDDCSSDATVEIALRVFADKCVKLTVYRTSSRRQTSSSWGSKIIQAHPSTYSNILVVDLARLREDCDLRSILNSFSFAPPVSGTLAFSTCAQPYTLFRQTPAGLIRTVARIMRYPLTEMHAAVVFGAAADIFAVAYASEFDAARRRGSLCRSLDPRVVHIAGRDWVTES